MLKKTPIVIAILCAIGAHILLFTDAGHRLQSSIVESDTTSHAEAHLVASDTMLDFRVNVTATNVTKIEGTLIYDDESIILLDPRSPIADLTIIDQDFSKKIVLTFPESKNITKGDTMVSWTMTPVLPEAHSINLTDVHIMMTDGGDRDLTTE